MKKIFTLLASFILTISLFAAARPKAMLTIQSYDQSDIRVVIDGRRFEPNTSYMRIRDMQPGYHQVKIYRERRTGFFTIFGQRYDMVYNNSIFVRPQSSTMITIDRFGRAIVSDNRMNGRNYDREDRGWGNDRSWGNNNDYDFGNGHNLGDYGDPDHDGDDHDGHWDGNRGSNNGGWDNNRGHGNENNGGYDNGSNYGGWDRNGNNGNGGYRNDGGYGNRQMSDYDFNRELSNISNQRGDYQKASAAKQTINANFLSSMQVKQILQQFSFESDKLDIAKLGYDKTVDKQVFFATVNDLFSYSGKDELSRYIRSH